MSRQHHDPGNKKRRAREQAAEHTTNHTPEHYARNLVRRGLAPANILTSPASRRPTHGGPRHD